MAPLPQRGKMAEHASRRRRAGPRWLRRPPVRAASASFPPPLTGKQRPLPQARDAAVRAPAAGRSEAPASDRSRHRIGKNPASAEPRGVTSRLRYPVAVSWLRTLSCVDSGRGLMRIAIRQNDAWRAAHSKSFVARDQAMRTSSPVRERAAMCWTLKPLTLGPFEFSSRRLQSATERGARGDVERGTPFPSQALSAAVSGDGQRHGP